MCHCAPVDVRGQFCGVASFLSTLHGLYGSVSGHQAYMVLPFFPDHLISRQGVIFPVPIWGSSKEFERWRPYYAHCSNKGRTRPETICNLINITDQWVELLDLSLTVCSGAHDLLLSCETELRSTCILPEHPRKGGCWSQTASWRMGLRTELRHSPQCCAVCRTVHS